jgi:hypothetical protein
MKRLIGCLILLAMAAGCSTIGGPRPEELAKLDFGPEATVRL